MIRRVRTIFGFKKAMRPKLQLNEKRAVLRDKAKMSRFSGQTAVCAGRESHPLDWELAFEIMAQGYSFPKFYFKNIYF